MEFAGFHTFKPVLCRKRAPHEKGRVESGVGYIKKSFLMGRDFDHFDKVNPAAFNWRDAVANVRIHGTTRKRPIDLFEEERKLLVPLPDRSYDTAVVKPVKATVTFRVKFESNTYSVPHRYAGKELTLKATAGEVRIFDKTDLVATHARSTNTSTSKIPNIPKPSSVADNGPAANSSSPTSSPSARLPKPTSMGSSTDNSTSTTTSDDSSSSTTTLAATNSWAPSAPRSTTRHSAPTTSKTSSTRNANAKKCHPPNPSCSPTTHRYSRHGSPSPTSTFTTHFSRTKTMTPKTPISKHQTTKTTNQPMTRIKPATLEQNLEYLKLRRIDEIYKDLAAEAGRKGLSHLQFLETIIDEEATARFERSVQEKIKRARVPVIKTLDEFDWAFPKKIQKQRILNLLDLEFISAKTNVILLGPTGVGKSHLAQAIAYQACLAGIPALFSTAIDIINTLNASLSDKSFMRTLKRFTSPGLLVCDELGYLPVDKQGADLLFQIISARYERGSIVLTSNRAFKDWGKTFNNDNTIASAVIDRLAHHSEVILIEGDSYRMRTYKTN